MTELKVKIADIDALGHVNNSVYVSYLEQARCHWFETAGVSVTDMHNRFVSTVVLRLDIFYVKEAKLDDVLTIKTIPVRLGNKSFVFEQVIFNQKGEIITEATVTNVMFDLITRKSIPVINEISQQVLNYLANPKFKEITI
jgi:YbgC/YbaW family acyl-CoA thioester hydrolase